MLRVVFGEVLHKHGRCSAELRRSSPGVAGRSTSSHTPLRSVCSMGRPCGACAHDGDPVCCWELASRSQIHQLAYSAALRLLDGAPLRGVRP
jgi:hypothetical protein